ncbi:hypothetical protein FB565_004288 [Actinoplanes lutulentus]|uniref:Uncharacterized protein n=1 Tax=Actinoplanes lutulentus TaxID=1287878 RepID=A0A327ZIJ8_9ACTN|nr:hypothetical protein [Actinoplanes lutulentus]MBB2944559.1 hypothetical protein [Actinoplanes lutulentus]RAK42210.1 hypothetical protein B0I29_10231 [Actinoplanes lutulentus]
MGAPATYPRAIGLAALQAVLSSAWIAARELPPAKRRLARLGTVAVVGAVGYLVSPDDASTSEDAFDADAELIVGENPFPVSEGAATSEPEPPFDKRKAALAVGAIGLSVAAIVARHQLEKRWLTRLTRNGHTHPTRALAVRMAGLEFAAQLAFQFADVRKARSRTS